MIKAAFLSFVIVEARGQVLLVEADCQLLIAIIIQFGKGQQGVSQGQPFRLQSGPAALTAKGLAG